MFMIVPAWFACAHPPETEPLPEPPPGIEVVVREDPGSDSWTVTYTFPEPVSGLWWTRTRNQFRADSWEAEGGTAGETEGVTGARWGEYLAVDGDRDTFTLRFTTDTAYKEKDYELNLAFSEGSRLLYTGHLRVAAMARSEAGIERQDPLPMRWRLETASERGIFVGRASADGSMSVGDLNDIYIYFGDLEPVADARVTAFIDPGMPTWMVEDTRAFVPEVFAYFAGATGANLNFAPTVFLSYIPGEEGMESYGGGGLFHQMQLGAMGQAWQAPTEARRKTWLWFLAHESFHMWNGQMFPTRGGAAEEWLSEGSASYFADRALRDLGHMDDAQFDAVMREHASTCLHAVGDAPLRTAHVTGRYRAFYACGESLMFVTERQAEAAGSNLGAVFGDLFRRAGILDGWSTYDLLEGIEALAEDPLAPAFIMEALSEGLDAETLGAALEGAGLPVAIKQPWEVERSEEATQRIIARRLGACDCDGEVSAENREGAIAFQPLETCDALAQGMVVTEIDGHPVATVAALEALETAIAVGEQVTLDGGVVLECGALAPLAPVFMAPDE